MILRIALAALGVLEVVWPRRTLDFWMDLAVRDGADVDLRPWVYTAARVEGVLILLWVLGSLRREEPAPPATNPATTGRGSPRR